MSDPENAPVTESDRVLLVFEDGSEALVVFDEAQAISDIVGKLTDVGKLAKIESGGGE